MSTSPAIVVDRVWKRFERGERHDSLRDLFPALVRRIVGGKSDSTELHGGEFWAVQDLSFEVLPGQALGIIGPNGAGKSTTLKLLNRILRPTRGRIDMTGRVSALIEVSSGFHGDLTGRENVFLQGAIMGMTAAEMRAELDSIIDFAGIDDFIDTPVKRYSSGMNARLGFAVAAHLRPDILLIDEVLSVGDREFQNRCFDRMRRFKREGVAIVFVTHDLQAMASLCDSAILLKSKVRASGTPSDVIAEYHAGTAAKRGDSHEALPSIEGSQWRLSPGVNPTRVSPGERLVIDASLRVPPGSIATGFSFAVRRTTDSTIANDTHFALGAVTDGIVQLQIEMQLHLTPAPYQIELYLFNEATFEIFDSIVPFANFSIVGKEGAFSSFGGVADLNVSVRETRADVMPLPAPVEFIHSIPQ